MFSNFIYFILDMALLKLITIISLIISTHAATKPLKTDNDVTSTQSPVNAILQSKCVVHDITLTNCTCNHKDACKIDDNHLNIFSLVYSSVTAACCALGILGNVAVLIIAVKRHKNLSHNNIILAELASIDFLLCIILFIDRARTFWYDAWPYGEAGCKAIRGGKVILEMIEGGLILVIALERFLGILHPIQCRRIKAKLTRTLFPVDIITAMGVAVPAIIGYNVNTVTGECEFKPHMCRATSVIYTWIQFGIYYLLTVLIAFVLINVILCFLRKQATIYQNGKMKDIRQRRIRDNYRMIYIAFSIMFAFIVCVYPLRILGVYLETNNYDSNNLNCYWFLIYLAYIIYPFHVMLNPIFYCLIDRNWRHEVLDLFHMKCRRDGQDDFDDNRGSFHMIGRLSSIVDNGR